MKYKNIENLLLSIVFSWTLDDSSSINLSPSPSELESFCIGTVVLAAKDCCPNREGLECYDGNSTFKGHDICELHV